MRNALLTMAPVLLSATLSAQGVFSNKTQVLLERVIQDYPDRFYNIRGELLSRALQTSQYKSTLQLPGSSSTTITLTASGTAGSGWSCTVLQTHDFGQARERFSTIYNQLSNSIITTAGQKTYILSGQYEEPAVDRKSTCVVFSLLPGVGDMKKLKVELSLKEGDNGWTIRLSVQDKDPREETQVAATSN